MDQKQFLDHSQPVCRTCAHWVDGIGDMPLCCEIQYWVPSVNGPVHTPSDFGCLKHSEITGDDSNVVPTQP